MIEEKLIGGLVLVAAFAAWTVGVFYMGGNGPRAELGMLTTANKLEVERRKVQDEWRNTQNADTISALQGALEKSKADSANGWSSYRQLLKSASVASPGGAKSVPVDATVCNDPEADHRLSDAIQKYRVGVRAALDDLEQRTGQLLEQAGVQGLEANELKDYLQKAKEINQ